MDVQEASEFIASFYLDYVPPYARLDPEQEPVQLKNTPFNSFVSEVHSKPFLDAAEAAEVVSDAERFVARPYEEEIATYKSEIERLKEQLKIQGDQIAEMQEKLKPKPRKRTKKQERGV